MVGFDFFLERQILCPTQRTAVSEEGTSSTNMSRCRNSRLVAWRHRRTSKTGYVPKDVTPSPVDIILVEIPTPPSSTLPCPMLIRAMSISTERTRYPPLQSLHALPPLRSLHIHGHHDALAYLQNHLAPFPRPLLRCLTRLTLAIHLAPSYPPAQINPKTKCNLIPSPFLSLTYLILHPPLSSSLHDAS
jgi:hypothetical protein